MSSHRRPVLDYRHLEFFDSKEYLFDGKEYLTARKLTWPNAVVV